MHIHQLPGACRSASTLAGPPSWSPWLFQLLPCPLVSLRAFEPGRRRYATHGRGALLSAGFAEAFFGGLRYTWCPGWALAHFRVITSAISGALCKAFRLARDPRRLASVGGFAF